jgi:hypothetical protein
MTGRDERKRKRPDAVDGGVRPMRDPSAERSSTRGVTVAAVIAAISVILVLFFFSDDGIVGDREATEPQSARDGGAATTPGDEGQAAPDETRQQPAGTAPAGGGDAQQ